jgi:1-acyl-sn-glycerol-3-phosphate acyltransferase
MDYDTRWARSYGVQLARAVVLDNVTRPVVRALASPTLEGADRLEGLAGPVVFAANHASHADTPLLLTCLPSRFRHKLVVAAGADYFFDKRWKGNLSAFALNAIPIERVKISRRSAQLPASLLSAGWNLLIYPEGGRTADGWSQEHRGGAAYLATKVGVPVVPIYVEGTRRVMKKGVSIPMPASTTITFGRPMRPAEGEDARRFAVRIEREVDVLADEHANGFWEARRHAATGSTPSLRGPEKAAGWRRAWELGEGRRPGHRGPVWPPR